MVQSGVVLTVENLTKRYRNFTALSELSFTVKAGEIVGLLGPNGAGKTTSLRCIAGIIRPTSGRIIIGDFDLATEERSAKRLLAFVPEQPNPYETLTVWEHLRFIALAYSTVDGFDARANALLERFDLASMRGELVGTLSKGMRQKLTIACAFLHRAQVFLFDEPLIGLDPKGGAGVAGKYRGRGKAGRGRRTDFNTYAGHGAKLVRPYFDFATGRENRGRDSRRFAGASGSGQ